MMCKGTFFQVVAACVVWGQSHLPPVSSDGAQSRQDPRSVLDAGLAQPPEFAADTLLTFVEAGLVPGRKAQV